MLLERRRPPGLEASVTDSSRPKGDRTDGQARSLNAILLSENAAPLAQPVGLLSYLDADDHAFALSLLRRQSVARGQAVFRQGDRHDGIWLIASGVIRVFYSSPAGREITLAYWYPGHFVGIPGFHGHGAHVWTAVAHRPSVVHWLPGQSLRQLIERAPRLAIGLLDATAYKTRCYATLAQMLGTRSAGERLAELLQRLAEFYGRTADGVTVIDAEFTHQDLASMVGVTRQWVTRSLARMAAQGAIGIKRRRILILRPDLLRGNS